MKAGWVFCFSLPVVRADESLELLGKSHIFPNHLLQKGIVFMIYHYLGYFCIVVGDVKLLVVVFDTFAKNLKARHAVVSENEPKLESAEPFAQRNLPVLEIIIITSCFTNHFLIHHHRCHCHCHHHKSVCLSSSSSCHKHCFIFQ